MQQQMTVAIIVIITFAAGFFTGRMSASPGSAAPVQAQTMNAPAAPMGATPFPGAAPMMAAPPAPSAPQGGGTQVTGTIAEIIQVPSFTYLRLSTANGDEWAAINANTTLSEGQKVSIGSANLMENFPSKTLNRTFEKIWFGELVK